AGSIPAVPPAARARPLARGTRGSEHRDMTKPSSLLPLCAVALALLPAIRAIASDPSSTAAPADAPQVRFNQLGFHPDATKLAVVEGATGASFEVVREIDWQPVLEGGLSKAARWAPSNRVAAVADVTALPPGRYRLKVDGIVAPDALHVNVQPYAALADAALKGFYFNRAGMALDTAHAGRYARAGGHPDTQVRVHASAASA